MQQQFITVTTYSRVWEAQIARNVLEESGIRAFIADENSAGLEGLSAMVVAKLQVAATDAKRARDLLAQKSEPPATPS